MNAETHTGQRMA